MRINVNMVIPKTLGEYDIIPQIESGSFSDVYAAGRPDPEVSRNIHHRWLKPENILYTHSPGPHLKKVQIKVTGFGPAAFLQELLQRDPGQSATCILILEA